MSAPLTPERLAEIRERVAQLDSDRILGLGTWLASSVGSKTVFPPEQSHVVEDVAETKHSIIRSSVGVFGDKRHAEFTAHARDDVPALLAEVERLTAENAELVDELGGRDEEASERWINKQLDETGIRSMDFRNGIHMDIAPARELLAHWVAAARTMLGDAKNYTETKLEFDVKVAESPEMYTLVVQRHGPGILTPHEARQQAEAEVARLTARVSDLETALAAAPYHEVWDSTLPPGGRVCSICGYPVESEPCPEHAPAGPRKAVSDE